MAGEGPAGARGVIMRRVFLCGAVAAGLLAGAMPASAEPADPSAPVTVTLSQEQLTYLCDKRLPKAQQRTERLINRISGGADVRGSVEWLRANAETERAAGRETTAQALEERAERRSERLPQLRSIQEQVTAFVEQYCGAK
jgi:hypothetical protein